MTVEDLIEQLQRYKHAMPGIHVYIPGPFGPRPILGVIDIAGQLDGEDSNPKRLYLRPRP